MELELVQARLAKLERWNRAFRLAGITLLLAACVGVLLGAKAPRKRVLEAERFVLRDSLGNERGFLELNKSRVALRFMDERGHTRLELSSGDMSSGIFLTDPNTFSQVFLQASNGESKLTFTDGNAKGRMQIETSQSGSQLRFWDGNGVDRAAIEQFEDNTWLRLRDAGQASSIEAYAGPTMATLNLFGPDHRPALRGDVTEKGASWSVMGRENKRSAALYRDGEYAGVAVWDRDGKVRFNKQ